MAAARVSDSKLEQRMVLSIPQMVPRLHRLVAYMHNALPNADVNTAATKRCKGICRVLCNPDSYQHAQAHRFLFFLNVIDPKIGGVTIMSAEQLQPSKRTCRVLCSSESSSCMRLFKPISLWLRSLCTALKLASRLNTCMQTKRWIDDPNLKRAVSAV